MFHCVLAPWLPKQGPKADRCSMESGRLALPLCLPLPVYRQRTVVRVRGVVFGSVDAVVRIEELLRHQGLVGDVGVSDERRHGARAGIKYGADAVGPVRRHILVGEQCRPSGGECRRPKPAWRDRIPAPAANNKASPITK